MQAVIDARGNLPSLSPLNDRQSHFTLPMGDTTLIEHVVDGLVSIGIERIAMVTDEESIRTVFGGDRDTDRLATEDVEINFVKHYYGDDAGKTNGLADDTGFLWVRGDILYDWDSLAELTEHESAIGYINHPHEAAHGRLQINGDNATASPDRTDHAGAHMAYAYKFPPSAHEWDYGIDPMTVELADTRRPELVPIRWTPIRNALDYLQANLDTFDAGDDAPDSTTIAHDATIIGPVVIGEDVHIEAGAVIESAVLLDGVTVGAGSYVGHSVVGEGATIEQNVTTNTRAANNDTVIVDFAGDRIDTGRKHFGAVVGPRSNVQAGVTLIRGTTVDSGLTIDPGSTV